MIGKKVMTEIEKLEAAVVVAKLRVLAEAQRANAAAHRRQAQKPAYDGQAEICELKARQLDATAAESAARADLVEAQARVV
jgi:hypothetical protein